MAKIKIGEKVRGRSLKDNQTYMVEGTLSHINKWAECGEPWCIVDLENGERWWCDRIERQASLR